MIKKIFADDSNLPYKTTKISALDSQRDINGILARWGITKVMWDWDLPNNKVELSFMFNEMFQGYQVNPAVRLKPPTIWRQKGNKYNKVEEIDWKLSMRIFFWWIKNQLAMSYALQSEKILAFLPHVVVDTETTVQDIIIPRLGSIKKLKALPLDSKVINVE